MFVGYHSVIILIGNTFLLTAFARPSRTFGIIWIVVPRVLEGPSGAVATNDHRIVKCVGTGFNLVKDFRQSLGCGIALPRVLFDDISFAGGF